MAWPDAVAVERFTAHALTCLEPNFRAIPLIDSAPYPTRGSCAGGLVQGWGAQLIHPSSPCSEKASTRSVDVAKDKTCGTSPTGCYPRFRSPVDRRISLRDTFALEDGTSRPDGCGFSFPSAIISKKRYDPPPQGSSPLSY